MDACCGGLLDLGRKTNILFRHPGKNNVFAAAAHHPFEAMVAVLTYKDSGFDELGSLLDASDRIGRRVNAFAHAFALERLLPPGVQPRSFGRREAVKS